MRLEGFAGRLPEVRVSRGIITLAFGPAQYIENARTLARSIRVHDPEASIAIVTDRAPADLMPLFDYVVPLDQNLGRSLLHKLSLDLYTPFDETMFIDSDCLVVRPLTEAWKALGKREVSLVGNMVERGYWFGVDIVSLRQEFALVGALPKFNSGYFSWSSGPGATAVFSAARELWGKYSSMGFQVFRANLPEADEPLMAIAMAQNGVEVLQDLGSIMNTPIGLAGFMRADVLRGRCSFTKNGVMVGPEIAHFCGPHRHGGVYRREAFILRLLSLGTPASLSYVVGRVAFAPLALLDHSLVWNSMRFSRRRVRTVARSVRRRLCLSFRRSDKQRGT